VGVKFTQDIPHGPGRFFKLGRGREPKLAHGVYDSALDRLESVTDMGQGAVQDDIHGVIQVCVLGKFLEGQALKFFNTGALGLGHTY
jgi:hypothetical protein